jgi:peptidyl-prolyl cis-trans isomerase A (cyclophilin A)
MKRLSALALVLSIAACEKTQPPANSAAKAPPAPPAEVVAPPSEALLTPDPKRVAATGPDSFAVHVVTTKGPFDVKVHRNWSPKGADRLYYLVSNGYYDGIRFFRVIDGFMAQFGAAGDTAVARVWRDRRVVDEPVKKHNTRGMLTFATSGPNSRTTQLFINYRDNSSLDASGFTPVGEVTNGMAVVDSLYNGYGEGAPDGRGPDQAQIGREGNAYLIRDFPRLDHIVTARVTEEWKRKKKQP